MELPKVSIITPVYNPDIDKFNRFIESIKSQSDKDFELILVEDGRDYLLEAPVLYGDLVPKFITIWDNYGPSVARNIGFQLSRGDIICYVDSDDEISVDRVKHLKEIFTKYPIKLLFDSYNIMQNRELGSYNIHTVMQRIGFDRIYDIIEKQNISIPLGFAHTRDVFVKVGGFQPGIVCGEDGIMLRRIIRELKGDQIMFTDFIAGTYYISDKGQSRTQRRFNAGGFAFDAGDKEGSNGQSLDKNWIMNYTSKGCYD